MICSECGGDVIWMGPLANLTHTQCKKCGQKNCQVPEDSVDDEEEDVPDNDRCCGCDAPLNSEGTCIRCLAEG